MIAHKLVIESILDVACERRAGGRTLPPVPGSVEDGRRQMRFTPTGKCADIAKVAAGVQRVSAREANQARRIARILVSAPGRPSCLCPLGKARGDGAPRGATVKSAPWRVRASSWRMRTRRPAALHGGDF